MKRSLAILIAALTLGLAIWLIAPLFIANEVQDELPSATPMSEEEMAEIIANMPDIDMDEPRPAHIVTTSTPRPITPPAETFPIVDTPGHPATGDIRIVDTGEETFVRYENYMGTNGPDLFVYLTNDLEATDFVNLGRSKGNRGNANYSVPNDVNIEDYKYAMVWCRAFGVLFDYAQIN